MKRSPLARLSKKRQQSNKTRRDLVEAYKTVSPQCQGGIGNECTYWITDVHEIVGRGVRPGAELEPHLFVGLCRPCHTYVTDNPKWARGHGLRLRSWEDTDQMLHAAARIRAGLVFGWCGMDKRCERDHLDDYEGMR